MKYPKPHIFRSNGAWCVRSWWHHPTPDSDACVEWLQERIALGKL